MTSCLASETTPRALVRNIAAEQPARLRYKSCHPPPSSSRASTAARWMGPLIALMHERCIKSRAPVPHGFST
jgi:hypothetical protein